MKARALAVPRAQGETVRRRLKELGLLRHDLVIRIDGGEIVLPVVEGAPLPVGLGRAKEADFDRVPEAGPTQYSDLLDWPNELKAVLPRSFDVVGDVVLVRVPPELDARSAEIGAALREFVPGARIVGADLGVHGPERRRSIQRIAGGGAWRTRHRENGIDFDVDLERAYFSPRLAHEHARIAELVRPDERVYDLCCGVGPFGATIARDGRARAVAAVDANPDAIALLHATLVRYPWGAKVAPHVARIEEFLDRAEPVERVIFNLPHEGIKYLPPVARAVGPRGHLTYYEVTSREGLDQRANDLVSVLGPEGHWVAVDVHPVHPYSPAADLIGYTFERGG